MTESRDRDRDRAGKEIGRIGEAAVARMLERRGFRILARRQRCRHAEIDILAESGDWLIAVEVKTRSRRWIQRFGHPEEGLHPVQLDRLRRALTHHPAARRKALVRIDLAAVTVAGGRVDEILYLEGIG